MTNESMQANPGPQELKLCPFCGDKGVSYKAGNPPEKCIECQTCGYWLTLENWNQRAERKALLEKVRQLIEEKRGYYGICTQEWNMGYEEAWCQLVKFLDTLEEKP